MDFVRVGSDWKRCKYTCLILVFFSVLMCRNPAKYNNNNSNNNYNNNNRNNDNDKYYLKYVTTTRFDNVDTETGAWLYHTQNDLGMPCVCTSHVAATRRRIFISINHVSATRERDCTTRGSYDIYKIHFHSRNRKLL